MAEAAALHASTASLPELSDCTETVQIIIRKKKKFKSSLIPLLAFNSSDFSPIQSNLL